MDPSKIASWGTAEDRPERDALRAVLIGRAFLAAYREARGGEEEHDLRLWFDWVRKNTAPDLQWMWSNDRAFKDEYAEVYAQVAGDLIFENTAKGKVLSTTWFKTDLDDTYGWLFEPACLEHDGWQRVEYERRDGKKGKKWMKATR